MTAQRIALGLLYDSKRNGLVAALSFYASLNQETYQKGRCEDTYDGDVPKYFTSRSYNRLHVRTCLPHVGNGAASALFASSASTKGLHVEEPGKQ